MLRRLVCTTAVIAVAGCGEPTTVPVGVATVHWIEWPAAVTIGEPGALRISGSAQCPFLPVFGVSVSGSLIRVTATARYQGSVPCLNRTDGSGAGYDTVLPLPVLKVPDGSRPVGSFVIRAPMGTVDYSGSGDISERAVGRIELRASADTTTQLAGRVMLRADSLGCWLAQPASAWPQPQFAFARPVPLAPATNLSRSGFVSGSLVVANPPICGRTLAIDAVELTVDVTPR